jgi:hypothetical protein
MAVLVGVIAALVGGQAIGAILGGLSIAQLVTLAQVGGQVGVTGIKVGVAVNRELDRRFPCDAKCHRFIAAHRSDMNGGPIGWGRSPYKNM